MLLEGVEKKGMHGAPIQTDSDLVPAAITDTGCERRLNEDRYAVIESSSGVAWLVCDGMGGEAGGELAAQLAIDAIRRDLETVTGRSPEAALRNAILEANRIIVLRRQNQAFAGMGTTAVAALFHRIEVVLANVGDSRAYLVRDGAIQQLSTDHTYVQSLVDNGQIRAEEALSHPQAHVLTRAIGSEPGLEVDLQKYWIWQVPQSEPSDFLVLCTDGLYSLVSEGEICNIASQNPPQRACVQLVELAKSRGGFDNVTLAIIPLPGQMRQEPPMGYDGGPAMRPVKKHALSRESMRGGAVRLFRDTVILSLLFVLLTILGVVFLAGR